MIDEELQIGLYLRYPIFIIAPGARKARRGF